MTQTIEYNDIVYTNCGDYLMVGKNNSETTSGVVPGKILKGDIVIPYAVNNIPIKIIGVCAFYYCNEVTSLRIEARITHIFERAFSVMYNLKSINIPNTVLYIGLLGIDLFNDSSKSVGLGTTIIEFEQGSKLEFIDDSGISQKEYFIIYYCETRAPKFNEYIYQNSKVTVYSPTRINFGGVMSKQRRSHCSCAIFLSCRSRKRFSFSCSLITFISSLCS